MKLPEVHEIEKSLVPHVKPERQKPITHIQTKDHQSLGLDLDKVELKLEEKLG